MMETIGITGNQGNPLVSGAVEETVKFMKRHKIQCFVDENLEYNHNPCNIEEMDVDLMICFGGDGELLSTFQCLGTKKVPVLGINCGELGFMMDLDHANFSKYLPLIAKGQFHVEKRNRIKLVDGDGASHLALNEFVIASSKAATIVRYGLKVNNEIVWRDSSDGVIVSTASGSTAYALSAGGPICAYNSKVILIVSLNSVSESTKPLIVPDDSEIIVFDVSSYYGAEIIIDGRVRLKCGPEVTITKSKHPALLARVTEGNYSLISSKMRRKINLISNISIKGAAPSVKFVLKVLESEGPLTQKELINVTSLPARTVRRALDDLIERGAISKKPFLGDPRQSLYIVNS